MSYAEKIHTTVTRLFLICRGELALMIAAVVVVGLVIGEDQSTSKTICMALAASAFSAAVTRCRLKLGRTELKKSPRTNKDD